MPQVVVQTVQAACSFDSTVSAWRQHDWACFFPWNRFPRKPFPLISVFVSLVPQVFRIFCVIILAGSFISRLKLRVGTPLSGVLSPLLPDVFLTTPLTSKRIPLIFVPFPVIFTGLINATPVASFWVGFHCPVGPQLTSVMQFLSCKCRRNTFPYLVVPSSQSAWVSHAERCSGRSGRGRTLSAPCR